MEKLEVLVSWSGDNYCAGIGKIGGAVMVTGKTLDAVKKEFVETFKFHIEGCIADGDDLPTYILDGKYEVEYKMEVSALLHEFEGILTRAALARATGINEKLLGHYATGYRKPRPLQREKIINGIHSIGSKFISVV